MYCLPAEPLYDWRREKHHMASAEPLRRCFDGSAREGQKMKARAGAVQREGSETLRVARDHPLLYSYARTRWAADLEKVGATSAKETLPL
jgi:hypothetical protein